MRPKNTYKKAIFMLFITCIMITAISFCSFTGIQNITTQNEIITQAADYDFEIFCQVDGRSEIGLEELQNYTDEFNTIPIDMYISPLRSSTAKIATLGGYIFFEDAVFSYEKQYIKIPEVTAGRDKYEIWKKNLKKPDDGSKDKSGIGFSKNSDFDGDNIEISKNFKVCTIYLEVDNKTPTLPTKIYWDFYDDKTGYSVFTQKNENKELIDYDMSRVKCTPFWIGEPSAEESADLSNLSLKGQQDNPIEYLTPNFTTEKTNYVTLPIPYGVNKQGLKLDFEKVSPNASHNISVKDSSNIDKTQQVDIDGDGIITGLADGDVISLNVTDGTELAKTYTIIVDIIPADTTAILGNLFPKIKGNKVSFDKLFDANTFEYTLNLPFTEMEATICATLPNEALSSFTIDGESVTEKTFKGLSVGTTTKEIVVTAEDGVTKNTYKVNIVRAAASQNVSLAELQVNKRNVEMSEGADTFTCELDESKTNFVVDIIGAEPNFQKIEYQILGRDDDYILGTTTGIAYGIKKNETITVYIRVTAQDNETSKVYTLNIHRAPSTVTELGEVSVKEGLSTTIVHPEGNGIYNYILGNQGEEFITVFAKGLENEFSTIRFLQGDDTSNNEVIGGIINVKDMSPGTYEYTIEVTPQDSRANKAYYTLNIIKKSSENELYMPKITHTNNNDAEIVGIEYDEATRTYKLTIEYELNGISVNDIRIRLFASPKSTITCSGWADLKQGSIVDGKSTAFADVSFNYNTSAQYINRTITVTAEDGSIQIYELKITRKAADTDNSLKSLEIGGVPVDGFMSDKYIYEDVMIFPGDKDTVYVNAVKNSEFAKVEFNGSSNAQIVLTRGVLKIIEVKVTAQDGKSEIYKVKVIAANEDNSIKDIRIKLADGTYLKDLSFDPAKNGYNFNIPYSIGVVTFEVITSDEARSKVYGKGTETLNVGLNQFKIYAESEAGVKGTEYTISLYRKEARTDNDLETLVISSGGTNPIPNYLGDFNSNTKDYAIRVDRDITSLKVTATVPKDNGSKIISGLTDHFTWTGTSATITILVKAEDGTEETYKVVVTRANDVNDIEDIKVDVKPIEFNKLLFDYNLDTVPFSTKKINFDVTLKDEFSKLYYKVNNRTEVLIQNPHDFDIELTQGENSISIYAKSEYGTKGDEYKFSVTQKEASDDARLKTLEVFNGDENLLKDFDPNKFKYDFRVDNDITDIVIKAVANDENADFTITPIDTAVLKKGLNQFYVNVVSESGDKKTYTINITQANDNNTITEIRVNGKPIELKPNNIVILEDLPYITQDITITVTLEDKTAKTYGEGTLSLADDINKFDVYAISEYGQIKGQTKNDVDVYTIQVKRLAPRSDKKLNSLIVSSKDIANYLEGKFNPSTYEYEIRVDRDITSLNINADVPNNGSKIISGLGKFDLGDKNFATITIMVEAEGGTKQSYKIEVTRANDINDIENIILDVEDISFDADKLTYMLENLPFSNKKINFKVALKDTKYSKLYVKVNDKPEYIVSTPESFDIELQNGLNNIKVYAVSEFGTEGKNYNFSVTQNKPSDDATLKTLEVFNGDENLLKGFDPEVDSYNLRVDNIVTSIKLNAVANDPNSIVSITPETWDLPKGKKTYYVKVLAESGGTKTYEINIIRANDNNKIISIMFDGVEVELDPNKTVILDKVPFTKKSVTVKGTLEDGTAKLFGTGTFDLEDGENVFEVYAISEYGNLEGKTKDDVLVYRFELYRTPASTDNTLENLVVKDEEGNIIPFDDDMKFDPTKVVYTITLDKDSTLDKVKIFATADKFNKQLAGDTGLQILNIREGGSINEQFVITVTSESGAQKDYTVNVLKGTSLSSDATIKEVTLKDLESGRNFLIFNDQQADQGIINIPYAIPGLTLNVVPNDPNARVEGTTGFIGVKAGGDSVVKFKVIAQDGTASMEYTFKIERESARTESFLDKLQIKDYNSGTIDFLEGIFESGTTTYNIRVDDDVEKIVLFAEVPENNGSKIVTEIANFYDLISGGTTPIIIIVQAEDGTTTTYTVNVQRANNDNEIKSIIVDGQEIPISEFKEVGDNFEHNLPKVPFSKKAIDIEVVLVNGEKSKATIKGDGIKKLEEGNNKFPILVTAQDGTKGKNYILSVERLPANNDANLKSLKVSYGEETVLFDATYPDIENSYTFDLNRSVDKIFIEAVKNYDGAIITGDLGNKALDAGKNEFKIYVTAEDGITNKVYTITINVLDDNNAISDITSDLPTLEFDKDTKEYNLDTVPYATEFIKFNVQLESEFAKLFINDVEQSLLLDIKLELTEGENNKFEIYAVSERGEKGEIYTVNIERNEADKNNLLATLEVTDGENKLTFVEGEFIPERNEYTIKLGKDSKITKVFIKATTQNGTEPEGDLGEQILNDIDGDIFELFKITVTAENGEKNTYIIKVVKGNGNIEDESSDNEIKSISLTGKGDEYLKEKFNPNIDKQTPIVVPYNVDSVYLAINAHEKAKITGQGLYNLAPGETKTIVFQVFAEDGTEGLKYSVNVTRQEAETNNTLSELYYEVEGERFDLDPTETKHKIFIKNTVNEIYFNGKEPNKAKVVGFGTYEFYKNDTHIITITAENGNIKNYIIDIVKQSDDATIKSIIIDGKEYFGEFVDNMLVLDNIPFAKKTLNVLATPTNENAKITGNGEHVLKVGNDNEIKIFAISQVGTKGEEYIIKVNRIAADTNNFLGNLIVRDTKTGDVLSLSPDFIKTSREYKIDLTDFDDVREIDIDAIPESTLATVEGTGKFILKTEAGESSEIFTVKVFAEDGSEPNEYKIVIIRNVKPDDDVSINDISLIGSDNVNYLSDDSDGVNKFELEKLNYEITVPYKTTSVVLTVTNNNGAVVAGNGNYELLADAPTVIEFYLDSKSGKNKSDTYTITINREAPNSDNSLSEIKINDELIKDFDPEKLNYDITVSLEDVDSINIGAVANDENAKVIGDLGNIDLKAGTNKINIQVTAENGDIKTYTVTVKRLSTDNDILDLGVSGYELSEPFDKENTKYSLTVPYTTEMVNVFAKTNEKATLFGNGHVSLKEGYNDVDVYAVSEQGKKGTVYHITIYREEASDDNTLKSLNVYSGVDGKALIYKPEFDPQTTKYIITIGKDSNINTLEITAEANCPYATVGGTGNKVLQTVVNGDYNNVFDIIVMAQNGSTKCYTIAVLRDDVQLDDDITIGELNLVGSDGEKYLGSNDALKKFTPTIFDYTVTVPYNVESVTLDITTFNATVYGVGTKSFGDSDIVEFKAYLVSQSGDYETDVYTITVKRAIAFSDNTLKYLRVNGKDIAGFDPETTQYNVNIDYLKEDEIIISALPNDPTAKILEGTGVFKLEEGRNVYSVLVRAQNGDTKSYNIVVNYLNCNALLESLKVWGSKLPIYSEDGAIPYEFEFDPENFEYRIVVDDYMKTVNIQGAAQDQLKAKIVGLGKHQLVDDVTRIIITVIAADNSSRQEYVIEICRTYIPSDNARLKDLRIGGSELKFDPAKLLYEITVGKDTGDVEVLALPEDPNAKVTIIGNKTLEVGKNAILVMVQAETGNTAVYQVIVNREKKNDNFLTILLIIVFLLWVATVTIWLITAYKKKHDDEKNEQLFYVEPYDENENEQK